MNNVNHNHILSLLQTGFTTIQITFDVEEVIDSQRPDQAFPNRTRRRQPQTYTYKALLSDNLRVGDAVIVDSPHDGLKIVYVTQVDETPQIDLSAPFPYKWIVQKVDLTRYNDLFEQEKSFRNALVEVERARQRETVLEGFKSHLPENSEARKLFDETIAKAKVLPHAE